MRHSKQEIDEAARRFEELADRMDPATAEVLQIDDLREVAVVSEAVRTDEVRLREAVAAARAHGRSWNQIAIALGVSRQAARQRFADKVHPEGGSTIDKCRDAAPVPPEVAMNPKYVAGPDIDLDREVVRDRKGRRITERRARRIAAETRQKVGQLPVIDRTTQKVPRGQGSSA